MPSNVFEADLLSKIDQHEQVTNELRSFDKLSMASLALLFGNGIVARDTLEAIMSQNVTGWPGGGLIPAMGSLEVNSYDPALPGTGAIGDYDVEINDGMLFIDGYLVEFETPTLVETIPLSVNHSVNQVPFPYDLDVSSVPLHSATRPGTREIFSFKEDTGSPGTYFSYVWDDFIEENGFAQWISERNGGGEALNGTDVGAALDTEIFLIYMGDQDVIDLTTLQYDQDLTEYEFDYKTPRFVKQGIEFNITAYPGPAGGTHYPGQIISASSDMDRLCYPFGRSFQWTTGGPYTVNMVSGPSYTFEIDGIDLSTYIDSDVFYLEIPSGSSPLGSGNYLKIIAVNNAGGNTQLTVDASTPISFSGTTDDVYFYRDYLARFSAIYKYSRYTINGIFAGLNTLSSTPEMKTELDVLDPVNVRELAIQREYGYLPLYVYQLVDLGDRYAFVDPIKKAIGQVGDVRLGIRTAI